MKNYSQKTLILLLYILIGICGLVSVYIYTESSYTPTLALTDITSLGDNDDRGMAVTYTPTNPRLAALVEVLKNNGVKVYKIPTDTINAYTDGKNIYVYSGLIKKLTPDSLFIAISHEAGHIVNLHSKRTIHVITNYINKCMDNPDMTEEICYTLAMHDDEILAFSRLCEYEADLFAFKVAKINNLPASTCVDLFSTLGSSDGIDKHSTHPLLLKRQLQCESYINTGTIRYTPNYETPKGKVYELILK